MKGFMRVGVLVERCRVIIAPERESTKITVFCKIFKEKGNVFSKPLAKRNKICYNITRVFAQV